MLLPSHSQASKLLFQYFARKCCLLQATKQKEKNARSKRMNTTMGLATNPIHTFFPISYSSMLLNIAKKKNVFNLHNENFKAILYVHSVSQFFSFFPFSFCIQFNLSSKYKLMSSTLVEVKEKIVKEDKKRVKK